MNTYQTMSKTVKTTLIKETKLFSFKTTSGKEFKVTWERDLIGGRDFIIATVCPYIVTVQEDISMNAHHYWESKGDGLKVFCPPSIKQSRKLIQPFL